MPELEFFDLTDAGLAALEAHESRTDSDAPRSDVEQSTLRGSERGTTAPSPPVVLDGDQAIGPRENDDTQT